MREVNSGQTQHQIAVTIARIEEKDSIGLVKFKTSKFLKQEIAQTR